MTLKEQCENYKGPHRKLYKKEFDRLLDKCYDDIFNHLGAVIISKRMVDEDYDFELRFENQGIAYGFGCIANEKTLIKLRDMLNKSFNF